MQVKFESFCIFVLKKAESKEYFLFFEGKKKKYLLKLVVVLL
jgi:hypothetical protein